MGYIDANGVDWGEPTDGLPKRSELPFENFSFEQKKMALNLAFDNPRWTPEQVNQEVVKRTLEVS